MPSSPTVSTAEPTERKSSWVLTALDSRRAAAVLVAIGLVVRLAALSFLAKVPLSGDARSYYDTAHSLFHGEVFAPDWPPGVPFLLGVAFTLFGESELCARAAMLVVYLLFSLALVAVGRQIARAGPPAAIAWGPRAAHLLLALFAVTPIYVWTSITPMTQLPTAALALGAVYFAGQCLRGSKLAVPAAWLGACLGGLILTRPSNIVLVAVLPAYMIWRSRRWQTLVIPAVVAGLFVCAWTYKAYTITGRFVFINYANSQNIYYGNNPWTPTYRTWWFGSRKEPGEDPPGFTQDFREILSHPIYERDHLFVERALTHIRARPDMFVVRTLSRVRTFAAFDTFVSAQLAKESKPLGAVSLVLDAISFLLLAGLALVYPAIQARSDAPDRPMAGAQIATIPREIAHLLVLVALLYSAPYFVVFSHPTFHVPAVPLLGFFGAAAGARLLETGVLPIWATISPRARTGLAIALVALAAIQIEWFIYLVARAA